MTQIITYLITFAPKETKNGYTGVIITKSLTSKQERLDYYIEGRRILGNENEQKKLANTGGSSGCTNVWVNGYLQRVSCPSGGGYGNGSDRDRNENQTLPYDPMEQMLHDQMPELDGGGSEYFDCANILNGSAYIGECGKCIGGTTGINSCAEAFNERIDDSELTDCIKSVISSVKNLPSNSVSVIIKKFSGNYPDYNWQIKFNDNTKYFMENGQYARTALEYLQDIGQVTTFLNSDPIQYQYASDLAIASTIIHESVHVYLTKLYFTDKGVILENYPEMLSRFFKQHRKPANEVQHNLFTKYFVEDIAKSLEDYGKSKGYTLESSFYKT